MAQSVDGSMRIILMPVQNEPSESHHRPVESTLRFGSMALKSFALEVSMTSPRCVHVPGMAVGLVARKMADFCEPNEEAA